MKILISNGCTDRSSINQILLNDILCLASSYDVINIYAEDNYIVSYYLGDIYIYIDFGKGFLNHHEMTYDEIKYKRYPCNSDEIIYKINSVSIDESLINSFSLCNDLFSNNNKIISNNTKTFYLSNNSNLSYSELIDFFQTTVNKLILLCLYFMKSPLDYYFEY